VDGCTYADGQAGMMLDWAVFQIGAREHYSIPRALTHLGRQVVLTTDVWVTPKQRRWFPQAWKSRWHKDLEHNKVLSWNAEAALFETQHKLLRSGMWQRCIARNLWFGKRAAKSLAKILESCDRPPILFAFSYAAREVFEVGKAHGCACILGQIDPGPGEMRLVRELAHKYQQAGIEEPPDWYWENWSRECELADRIVVNSPWSGELLKSAPHFNVNNFEKIRVIPLAFEKDNATGSFRDASASKSIPERFTTERPLDLLFLGQVILRKGVKELADAARLLADAPVRWTIIGSGSTELLTELSRCPNTRVLGGVSRQSVANWYQSSDVFILPTHSDGYAITQLEAAAYGLPIIASSNCGRVVEDGVNGLLLTEVSGNAIADAVRRLLVCPTTLAAMRSAQLTLSGKTIADLQANLFTLEAEITQRPKPTLPPDRGVSAC
jgi:hypothetical protein